MVLETSISQWFLNYLANRKQCDSLDQDLKTGTKNILCEVPQGSIY